MSISRTCSKWSCALIARIWICKQSQKCQNTALGFAKKGMRFVFKACVQSGNVQSLQKLRNKRCKSGKSGQEKKDLGLIKTGLGLIGLMLAIPTQHDVVKIEWRA